MLRVYGIEPLPIWACLTVLAILFRRDRRLLFKSPTIALFVVLLLLASYAAVRALRVSQSLQPSDVTFLYFLLTVAAGIAIPIWWCWVRAIARQDLPRMRFGLFSRAECLWTLGLLLLSMGAAGAYYQYGSALSSRGAFERYDVLFDSDAPRYMHLMNGTAHHHEWPGHKHPLYALFGYTLFMAVQTVRGVDAVLAVNALLGGLSVFLAALYFRLVTHSRGKALLLTIALAGSAGHVVFGATPESYSMSACAIILLHLLTALRARGGVRMRHEAVAAALAAGVTITSIVQAVICFGPAHLARRPLRWLRRWLAAVVLLIAGLLVVQGGLLDYAIIIIDVPTFGQELEYTADGRTGGRASVLYQRARGLLVSSIIAARPSIVQHPYGYRVIQMGDYRGVFPRICAVVWLATMAMALLTLLAATARWRPTLRAAMLCLVFNVGLHAIYGWGNLFLYSCHVVFLLLAIVAHAAGERTRLGWVWPLAILAVAVIGNTLAFCGHLLDTLERIDTGASATAVACRAAGAAGGAAADMRLRHERFQIETGGGRVAFGKRVQPFGRDNLAVDHHDRAALSRGYQALPGQPQRLIADLAVQRTDQRRGLAGLEARPEGRRRAQRGELGALVEREPRLKLQPGIGR